MCFSQRNGTHRPQCYGDGWGGVRVVSQAVGDRLSGKTMGLQSKIRGTRNCEFKTSSLAYKRWLDCHQERNLEVNKSLYSHSSPSLPRGTGHCPELDSTARAGLIGTPVSSLSWQPSVYVRSTGSSACCPQLCSDLDLNRPLLRGFRTQLALTGPFNSSLSGPHLFMSRPGNGLK